MPARHFESSPFIHPETYCKETWREEGKTQRSFPPLHKSCKLEGTADTLSSNHLFHTSGEQGSDMKGLLRPGDARPTRSRTELYWEALSSGLSSLDSPFFIVGALEASLLHRSIKVIYFMKQIQKFFVLISG